MRRLLAVVAILVSFGAVPCEVHAQSETDRLREAVRSMTGRLRALEDQRVQMQAQLSQAEREKQLMAKQAEQFKVQIKDLQDTMRQAVDEFNQRLADRDKVLERWKDAYNQAADVAREKDGLRAKFESEAGEYRTRTKSCETKNAELMKTSSEILARFSELEQEPLIGIGRVGHQNTVQGLRARILDQDVKLPLTPDQARGGESAPGAKEKGKEPKDQAGNRPKNKKNGGQRGGETEKPPEQDARKGDASDKAGNEKGTQP